MPNAKLTANRNRGERQFKMGLKIMSENGVPRDTWYARFTRGGQKVNVNLGVPLRGTIPTTTDADGHKVFNVNGKGDDAFERSREAARAALAKMMAAAKTTGDTQAVKAAKTADIQKRYYRARTGKSIKGVRLIDLPNMWAKQKRSYTPTENWQDTVSVWFRRFANFAARKAAEHGARCEYVNEITDEIAAAWFDEIKGAFAWETVTKMMSLMRNAYAKYATSGEVNPFAGIITRNRETANARKPHKPLVGAELERLFECASDNKDVYSLIVTAACTGMRCGDVCRLKWCDVDLPGGFIDVTTAKAGVKATIPIFGRLHKVLTERAALPADGKEPSAFVFPLAAKQYAENPTAIYRDAKPYFARAVFGDAEEEKPAAVGGDGNVIAPPALEDVIDGARFIEAKRNRLLEVNRRFRSGEPSNLIAAALKVARSQVSMDLREIEKLTGESLRPRAAATAKRKTTLDLIEKTRERRKIGKRAASIFGYHSLRATFVVLASEAGVPLADIARVVGHTKTATTMEYFNPEKKHAAERVRQQMRGGVLDGRTQSDKTIADSHADAVAPAQPSVDALIAGLTVDQRKELARKLLGL